MPHSILDINILSQKLLLLTRPVSVQTTSFLWRHTHTHTHTAVRLCRERCAIGRCDKTGVPERAPFPSLKHPSSLLQALDLLSPVSPSLSPSQRPSHPSIHTSVCPTQTLPQDTSTLHGHTTTEQPKLHKHTSVELYHEHTLSLTHTHTHH